MQISRKNAAIIAAATVTLIASGAQSREAMPEQTPGGHTYGAFVGWTDNGEGGFSRWAVAHSRLSRDDATAIALARCARENQPACEVILTIEDECGAVAIGSPKRGTFQLVGAAGATLAEARAGAVEACGENGGVNCRITVNMCSDEVN